MQNIIIQLLKCASIKQIQKSLLPLIAVIFLTVGNVHGQAIATYVGSSGTSTATSALVPGETVSILQVTGFGANTACGSGGLSGLTNNGVFAYATTNAHAYMQILPTAGYTINVTGFIAGLRRSNSGIQKVRFAYSLDGGVTWTDDGVDHVPNNGGCGTTALSSWGGGTLPTGITSTTNGIIVALYPYDPIASGGVIQINTIEIDGTVVASNNPPTFVGGATQPLTVCENSGATSINALMAINDPDVGQTETWTVVIPPANGTLSGFSTSALSTGGTVTPTGLTYTPNPGFSGTDAMKIQISDGIASAATLINITVNPSPAPITGNTTVCIGSVSALGSITSGGTWSSTSTSIAPVGSASGVVSGVALGTSTISYTISTGCVATTVVTVDPLPGAITGTTNVCVGSNTALSNSSSGGTWSSNDVTIATVVAGTGVVTGVANGTTTITYTIGTGCTVTTTITVNPLPAAITGATNVCVGLTTTLNDVTTGGTWSSTNTLVAPVGPASGIVSGAAVGTSIISYTLSTGCAASTVVTVNPSPGAITGTMSVCVGSNTTLSNSAAGGTWTSNNVGVATVVAGTGVVTGVSNGTTTITYALAAGCAVTAIITVNPLPAAITGATNVCVGLTTTLSDLTGVGTWSSGAAGIASVVPGTGVVTGVAQGSATISYIVTLTGCATSTTVTVNPLPGAITGTLSVCQGLTTALGDPTTGGTWSSGNLSVAAIDASGLVTGVAPGTATITYTLATGCINTAVVTVNTLPSSITGGLAICAGLTSALGSSPAGGTWSISAASAGVATVSASGVVAGIAPGTATVTYTLGTGCIVTTMVTVSLSPAAISGAGAVCTGLATTMTDGTTGGTWMSSNTLIATVGSGTGVVIGVAAGTATITYTLSAGCTSTTVVTVSTSPSAISGSTTVCTGLTSGLSNTVGGGTWVSDNTSVATIGFTSGIVNALLAGTANITYTLPGNCTATTTVTVNTTVVPIAGSPVVCAGSSTALSDATAGGTWTSSNAVVATINSSTGLVSGLVAGTSIISYTTGSCTPVGVIVTVNPIPTAITGITSVCAGYSTTLHDAFPDGVWISSDVTIATVNAASGIVSGVAAGTTTISYLLSTGCQVTATITVNPMPAAITGTSAICVLSSTTLNNAVGGGTWTSAAPGIAAVGAGTGLIFGITAGNTIITYTLTGGCYSTFPVAVSAAPTAITGPSAVCTGNTITLSESVTTGAWSSSSPGIASVNPAGVVTAVAAGITIVSYATPGCTPATYYVTVSPSPAPIAGITNVCAGLSTTLSDAVPGGTWTTSDTSIHVSSTGVVTGLKIGSIVYVTYTLSAGCYVSTAVIADSLPSPITGIDSVCQGSSTVLSSATPGGAWSSSDGTIATSIAFTGEVIGAHAGTVHISYTLVSGCYVDTVFKVIAPLPASLSVTTNAPDSICAGTSVLFTAHPVNGGAGATFSWKCFVPGSTIGTGLTYSYAPTHWDYVECTMVPSGCASPDTIRAAVTMNVFPDVTPVVTITSNLQNDTITYLGELVTFQSNITSGGVLPAYQWYKNGMAISGATSTSYSTRIYNVNDTFYLKVVATSPCDASLTQLSNGIIIYSNSYLAVKTMANSNSNLSLFPNPNNGSFTLNGKTTSGKEMDIDVADMLGRIVYTGKTTPVNGIIHAELALPGDMAAGNYVLRTHSDMERNVFHFVISK